jgi:hypothetical protein
MWWSLLRTVVNRLVRYNAENLVSRLPAALPCSEEQLCCVELVTCSMPLLGTDMMDCRYNFTCIIFVS